MDKHLSKNLQSLGKIKHVNKATGRLMMNSYGGAFKFVFIGMGILMLIMSVAMNYFENSHIVVILVLGVIAVLITAFNIFGVYITRRVKILFMKQFAQDHELIYAKTAPLSSLVGRLFNVGYSRRISHVMLGEFESLPMRMFNYTYSTGARKNRRIYNFTVMEISFSKTEFPFILLRSRSMSRFGNTDNRGTVRDREISLRGKFKKDFKLIVSSGYEVEALQIFTESTLEKLQDHGAHYSIEFSENKMYIYDDLSMYRYENLEKLYTVSHDIYEKLTPLLKRLHDDFDALHPYYKDRKGS